jgi:hypothetical protein
VNAAGQKAKLEVKAWNEKRWQKELAANYGKPRLQGLTKSMVEQLQAAKQTGDAVYLAVSDAIGDNKTRLEELLRRHDLGKVVVITFPESKLKAASAKLHKGLVMGAAGLPLVTADDIAEYGDE